MNQQTFLVPLLAMVGPINAGVYCKTKIINIPKAHSSYLPKFDKSRDCLHMSKYSSLCESPSSLLYVIIETAAFQVESHL